MSTNFHIASAPYPIGIVTQVVDVAAGLSKAVASLSHDTGWLPGVSAITYNIDFSYDNGVTWDAYGGGAACGMSAGTLDFFGALLTASTYTVTLNRPSNATTKARITLNVLMPIMTTIDLTVT